MAKKIEVATIKIWGKKVGAVSWNDDKRISQFQYEPDFLKSGIELSPVHMPLDDGEEIFSFRNLQYDTYRGLPGLLSDCLPDDFGNKIIDAWLAQEGRSKEDFSPIERLCYTGKRGMGALEFEPIVAKTDTKSEPIQISTLVEVANEILNDRESFSTKLGDDEKEKKQALKQIIRVGTSAGGARPKAVIAVNDTTGEIRSGQVEAPEGFEHWLLKFDGVSGDGLGDPEGYGRVEYAYYLMAKELGIEMTECRLHKENGRAHFMTRRFDRENGKKHHIQSLCAMAHYDYKSPGAYSYEQAFQIIRKLRMSHEHTVQLFKRMALNIIGRNQDDHTKNISFILKQGQEWALTPAYDVTHSYRPGSKWVSRHQMTMNGKEDNFTEEDFIKIAESVEVSSWKEILEKTIRVVADWRTYAEKTGVKETKIKEIEASHRIKYDFSKNKGSSRLVVLLLPISLNLMHNFLN